MKSPFFSLPMVAACVALASSGCSADGAPSPAAGPCNAEAAQGLVGKEKPTDAEPIELSALMSPIHSISCYRFKRIDRSGTRLTGGSDVWSLHEYNDLGGDPRAL